MEEIRNRLSLLLTVKSIVTIFLTIAFSILSLLGRITAQEFLTIFSVVIAFYFGTQSQKNTSAVEQESKGEKS